MVADDVGRLCLERTRRFDPSALTRLVRYVARHDIRILHAHSTSVFAAVAAALFHRRAAVVWHDHFGRDLRRRRAWHYRPLRGRLAAVVAVNSALAEWATRAVGVPADRVYYVRNFVVPPVQRSPMPWLPGAAGYRIISVANWREQKDHLTLLEAFAQVARAVPEAHLLLVGSESEDDYGERIRSEISRLGLETRISRLGYRPDIASVLQAADIGVLSSRSEGLPLALLDYGTAGLAAVATRVGQCAEVLDEGRAGDLVSPGSAEQLAEAMMRLLREPARRARAAQALRTRVETVYSPDRAIRDLVQLYRSVLGPHATGFQKADAAISG
jgi:glycosyltransferase involved in cell wall biosynthesis